MATQVFKNAMLVVNAVDLSASVVQLALSYQAESLDETAMGDNSRKMRGGLKSQGVDITFNQKYSCVDATLFPLLGCQTCVEIRGCNACAGETNPRWAGTYLLQSYPPMSGGVGAILQAAVRFEPAGDLSRALTCP